MQWGYPQCKGRNAQIKAWNWKVSIILKVERLSNAGVTLAIFVFTDQVDEGNLDSLYYCT